MDSNATRRLAARTRAPTDEEIVRRWLSQVSPSTRETYGLSIKRFKTLVSRPLAEVAPADVQDYLESVEGAPATKAKALAAVKSCFRFATLFGFLTDNPAAPVRAPRFTNQLGERYLSEDEVRVMIEKEPESRNKLILETLYRTGLRVSEFSSIRWENFSQRPDIGGAQLTIVGKRTKKRSVLVDEELWAKLKALREDAPDSAPVFQSRKGGHLDRSQILRIVKAAAKRAGVQNVASPHVLRHAHATHAIANGAPLHVVQQSLGHSSLSVTGLYLHARPQDSSALYLKKGGKPP